MGATKRGSNIYTVCPMRRRRKACSQLMRAVRYWTTERPEKRQLGGRKLIIVQNFLLLVVIRGSPVIAVADRKEPEVAWRAGGYILNKRSLYPAIHL